MSASITLTLTHNANGGTGGPSTTSVYGSYTTAGTKTLTVNASSSKPTRTGYNFTGWSPSSVTKSYTFTQSQIDNGASIKINATTTAQWSIKKYTVTYNANGGTEAPASQTKTYGKELLLSTEQPSRYGYRFLRWNTAVDGSGTDYNGGDSYTSNAALTLYAVWENVSSYPTVNDGNIGSAVTITITDREAVAASYDVSYSFGNESGTIASRTTSKSISWTPAMSLCSQIPNSTSGTCIITVKSYDSDGNDIGSDTDTCTLTVPTSVVPSVDSCNFSESASVMLALNWGIFVQSKSEVIVSANASGVYDSTIDSWSINVNGTNYTGSGAITATTAAITASGTLSCTVTVNDSRGRSASGTYTFYVYPYSSPAMPVRIAQHDDDTEDVFVLQYKWNIFPCNNKNIKKLEYRYEKSEVGEYTPWATLTTAEYQPENSITGIVSVPDSDNYDYRLQYRVSDSFAEVVYTIDIPNQSSTIIDICPQYSTIAFGMKCVEDDFNHVNKAIKFHHGIFDGSGTPLRTNPDLLINGWFIVNQRGAASYTSAGYTADMWEIGESSEISLSDNVVFSGTLRQIIRIPPELLLGKTVTLTILTNGVYYENTGALPVSLPRETTACMNVLHAGGADWNIYYDVTVNMFTVVAVATSAEISAVKLELGSQSTLAGDIPDYNAERDRCKPYYYRLDPDNAFEAGLGSVYDLLWENPNTKATFAAQTISLDLSGYDFIGVEVVSAYNSEAQFHSTIQMIPKDGVAHYAVILHATGNYNFMRAFTMSDDGVVITEGYRNGSHGTGYCIPAKIYGIKGATLNADL